MSSRYFQCTTAYRINCIQYLACYISVVSFSEKTFIHIPFRESVIIIVFSFIEHINPSTLASL